MSATHKASHKPFLYKYENLLFLKGGFLSKDNYISIQKFCHTFKSVIDSFLMIFGEGLSFIYLAIIHIFCDDDGYNYGEGYVHDNDNGDDDDDFYLD